MLRADTGEGWVHPEERRRAVLARQLVERDAATTAVDGHPATGSPTLHSAAVGVFLGARDVSTGM